MDDASLDDFLDTGSESGASGAEDEQDSTGGGTASTDETEPAPVTSQWVPAGASCDQCSTELQRLWTDSEDAVCRDCKEW